MIKDTKATRTDLERRIPAPRAKRHTISANAQTTYTVFMTGKHANALALERIPDIAGPVVVAAKQDTARHGECDARDSTQDIVVGEGVELAIGADVEESAGGVVGASSEGVAVREEAVDGV